MKRNSSFFVTLVVFVGFIALAALIQNRDLVVAANSTAGYIEIKADSEVMNISPFSNTSGIVLRERLVNGWGLGSDTRSVVHAASGTGGRIGADAWLTDPFASNPNQRLSQTGWQSAQGSITVRTEWRVDPLNRFLAHGTWG